jgi:quercetin dioxygenase-like cupin family protein
MAIEHPTSPATADEFVAALSSDRARSGYALTNDQGEAFWLLGMLQTIRIGRDDTGGRYGLLEIVVPKGLGSPYHVHPEEDEWFYVLDGEITFYVAENRLSLPAGSFGFGPKGIPHTFFGQSDQPARALVGFQPMQFEGFVREVGVPAPARVLPPPMTEHPDPAKLAPIARRNGFIILGPPGPPAGH